MKIRVLILFILIATLMVFAIPTQADDDGGEEVGAVVIEGKTCWGFVPKPNGLPRLGPWIKTTDSQQVMTPSGNIKLTCHFTHTQIIEKATKSSGFACNTAWGTTYDTKIVATPDGYVNMTCVVKAE
ncbi:MAG: hypothetical protein JXA10_15110 [Anaerolineae bacterium]|nr:hypothetical protein [Anaerolineae bacterium]